MPKPCATDYLRVNQFLGDAVSTRAVATALECGLVDVLLPGSLDTSALETRTGLPPAGLELLLAALRRAGCVEHVAGRWQLTDAFQAVLRYRDLLTVKAETALAVAPDLLARFDLLLTDPAAFQQAARLFDLFDRRRPAGAELDPAFGDLPVWMFWHAYRQPDDYVRQLSAGGWTAVQHEEIMADMPWMLIQAVKPPAAGSEA